jgi:hypothetical protein
MLGVWEMVVMMDEADVDVTSINLKRTGTKMRIG